MPNTKVIPDQTPVSPAPNLQVPVSEADLGRGSIQMQTAYTKADRVTGGSGAISDATNPVGVERKTMPGLDRQ